MPDTITRQRTYSWGGQKPLWRSSSYCLAKWTWYWAAFYIVIFIPLDSTSSSIHHRRYFLQGAWVIQIQTWLQYSVFSSNCSIYVTPPTTRLKILWGRRSRKNVKARDQGRLSQNSIFWLWTGHCAFVLEAAVVDHTRYD